MVVVVWSAGPAAVTLSVRGGVCSVCVRCVDAVVKRHPSLSCWRRPSAQAFRLRGDDPYPSKVLGDHGLTP